jgi:3-oxoacyl-[acyl-carrier-protein] synthase-3
MTIRAVVRGVGHYLPERVVPNSEFEASLDTSDEWIKARSGIERRHFAAEGETTSDLATHAARAALAHAGLQADDIDAIIVATSTADLTFPSAATMVQANLGMTRGFAFDVQAVCAGFVFALTNANALIISGQAQRVLVIGAETFSRIMDWQDRSTCVLFGDGAGALILEAQQGQGDVSDRGILAADLNSDGRHRDILYVDGGISTQSTGFLRMEGKEVFRHAIEKLAATAHTALEKAGLKDSDVGWIGWWLPCKTMAIHRLHRFLWRCRLGWRADRSNRTICWSPRPLAAVWHGVRWFCAGSAVKSPHCTHPTKPLILTRKLACPIVS